MSFQERNASWQGTPSRRFVQLASHSPRFWTVWTEGDTLFYQWGQVDGATQQASEKAPIVNIGKKNEVDGIAKCLSSWPPKN